MTLRCRAALPRRVRSPRRLPPHRRAEQLREQHRQSREDLREKDERLQQRHEEVVALLQPQPVERLLQKGCGAIEHEFNTLGSGKDQQNLRRILDGSYVADAGGPVAPPRYRDEHAEHRVCDCAPQALHAFVGPLLILRSLRNLREMKK